MLDAFSVPGNRSRTAILLALGGLLGVAAALVGLDDNPPGILLALLSACALVVGVVHPWRTSRQFRRLIYASGVGLVGFAILHNVLDAVASNVDGLVGDVLEVAAGVMFFAATLLCPAGVLVGAVGAVVMLRREHSSLHGASSV